ncbi:MULTISPECIES: hypothetical protein [Halobacterium]|uniref:hypothetical protein n=1 Tax=Halobacterium TaxID=2239 RepID=UPI001964EBBC|nr:hypothetical protein [Halobacterium sp. BOL4-2]QRY26378.1 hypothetical protein JRZ79_13085 [Halobacterium sp. BOL4-2]
MSTATNQPEPQPSNEPEYDCGRDDCDNSRSPSTTVAGSFCSQACATRHHGQHLLNLIRHDNRYCYTCFGRLKDVQEPTEKWRTRKTTPYEIALDQGACFEQASDGSIVLDASSCGYRKAIDPKSVIGYQYATDHATTGEVRVERTEGMPDDTRIGLICQCGSTDARVSEDVIRTANPRSTVRSLLTALETLREEEQHDKEIDGEVLVRKLRIHYRETGELDFPRAVGAAIQETTDG